MKFILLSIYNKHVDILPEYFSGEIKSKIIKVNEDVLRNYIINSVSDYLFTDIYEDDEVKYSTKELVEIFNNIRAAFNIIDKKYDYFDGIEDLGTVIKEEGGEINIVRDYTKYFEVPCCDSAFSF